MSTSGSRRGGQWSCVAALLAATASLTISCAPQPIEIKSGPTDCAWVQAIYLGEDSIAALAERESALKITGEYERAFRLRLDRKAIGDHNRLFERNCAAPASE